MSVSLWEKCLNSLESEFPSQQFNTWIRPLQAEFADGKLVLLAPNRFVLDWIVERFLTRINELVAQFSDQQPPPVMLEIGSKRQEGAKIEAPAFKTAAGTSNHKTAFAYTDNTIYQSNINPNFNFDNFVEGKSNQLAKAASLQVAENPAVAYNPLYLYGGGGIRQNAFVARDRQSNYSEQCAC